MRKLLLLGLFWGCWLVMGLGAQDYHFSDPTRSMPLFNPAYTGFIPGAASNRLTTVARSQWGSVLGSSAYRTAGALYDHRFCGGRAYDYFAFGVNASFDFQGEPTLRRTDLYASGSFVQQVGDSRGAPNLLGGGVEVGRIQFNQDGLRGATFDEQFDDPNAPGELLDVFSVSAFDVGIGAFLNLSGNTDRVHDLTIGASVKHLTQPILGFYDDPNLTGISSDSTARLNRRWNVNAGFSFLNNNRRSVNLFAAYSLQRPHNQLLVRATWNIITQRQSENKTKREYARLFSVGGAVRLNDGAGGGGGDALIGIAQFHQPNFILSIAYDYNISNLNRSTGGNGAVELGATFIFGGSNCGVFCPTF